MPHWWFQGFREDEDTTTRAGRRAGAGYAIPASFRGDRKSAERSIAAIASIPRGQLSDAAKRYLYKELTGARQLDFTTAYAVRGVWYLKNSALGTIRASDFNDAFLEE
jgi:hypothetical protein